MTAVEQFIEQLEKQGDSWENVSMKTINISINVDDYLKLKNQTKEMEKEQILRAHSNGWNNGIQGNFITTQEYYNETFKSE